jgi:hypothetical protein
VGDDPIALHKALIYSADHSQSCTTINLTKQHKCLPLLLALAACPSLSQNLSPKKELFPKLIPKIELIKKRKKEGRKIIFSL